MHAHAVLARQLPLQLADSLDVGQRLDVAHHASYLRDDHVIQAGALEKLHPALDLVGDVGYDLHGLAEIRSLPLLLYDSLVDAAGGDVVGLRHAHVQETLVVTEVQVGLRTVVGDIAFAVLVGVQGSGIHIDVGIELLDRDTQSPALEQFGDGCGKYSLAQRRSHAACYKNILRPHSYVFSLNSSDAFMLMSSAVILQNALTKAVASRALVKSGTLKSTAARLIL